LQPSASNTPQGQELFIGLVGAIGTNLYLVSQKVQNTLEALGYSCHDVHIIDLLTDLRTPKWKNLNKIPATAKKFNKLMDAGNEFCRLLGRGDALALLGMTDIQERRKDTTHDSAVPAPRQAYILRSLKRPEEVRTLRAVYGPCFLLISIYSEPGNRKAFLERKMAPSSGESHVENLDASIDSLILRDEKERYAPYGQNVQDTFALADLFVNGDDISKLEEDIGRAADLFFGSPFITPKRDEYLMFLAKAAALRSADLSRQVGAVIASGDGNVVAVGCNEVPKAGGGMYWADDVYRKRDFEIRRNSGQEMKETILAEMLKRLCDANWLSPERRKSAGRRDESTIRELASLMKDAQVMNSIEFGRTQHGEMAALIDASCRGVSVCGCTLYTTTFPCHNCAKHIISAGIKRVVYVEPYPKSRAKDLHGDAICLGSREEQSRDGPVGGKVGFEPFVGIAPSRYLELFAFTKRERTNPDGSLVDWSTKKKDACPRFVRQHPDFHFYYIPREIAELREFATKLTELQLLKKNGKKKERATSCEKEKRVKKK
jgi:cytidine deaminase